MFLRRLINNVLEPYFLLISFLVGLFVYLVIGFISFRIKLPFILEVQFFLIAFAIVAAFRWDWKSLMKDLSVDEDAARRAVEAAENFDRAVLAERREKYGEAAELYEKVLAHQDANIQARLNLARIYVGKLDDRGNGLIHLEALARSAPKGHPYHRYAVDELRNMDTTDRTAT